MAISAAMLVGPIVDFAKSILQSVTSLSLAKRQGAMQREELQYNREVLDDQKSSERLNMITGLLKTESNIVMLIIAAAILGTFLMLMVNRKK